jgi:putative ABC transport system permease protein
LTEGSVVRPNNPSSILVAEDIAYPPGEETPFIYLGQSVTLKYSFVDDKTGKQEEESKNFVVSGIVKSTGNPTIDDAVVINLDAGNTLLQKAGKYDALFAAAAVVLSVVAGLLPAWRASG